MQSEQQYLQNYDPSRFEHPSVTVDILIFTVSDKKLRLLLIKRNMHPFMGKWAIPGGFLRIDESADEAAARRIREEAGVKDVHLEQLYTFSAVDRDPRTRVISIAYLAAVPFGKLQFSPGTGAGAEQAELFTVEGFVDEQFSSNPEVSGTPKESEPNPEGQINSRQAPAEGQKSSGLTPAEGQKNSGPASAEGQKNSGLILTGPDGTTLSGEDLAFDHACIIHTAVSRMRGKLDYTDLAFGFLEDPSAFSLTELRIIHEAILDRKLDIGNFRRTIKREYEAAGRITEKGLEKGSVGRPAMLYRMRR